MCRRGRDILESPPSNTGPIRCADETLDRFLRGGNSGLQRGRGASGSFRGPRRAQTQDRSLRLACLFRRRPFRRRQSALVAQGLRAFRLVLLFAVVASLGFACRRHRRISAMRGRLRGLYRGRPSRPSRSPPPDDGLAPRGSRCGLGCMEHSRSVACRRRGVPPVSLPDAKNLRERAVPLPGELRPPQPAGVLQYGPQLRTATEPPRGNTTPRLRCSDHCLRQAAASERSLQMELEPEVLGFYGRLDCVELFADTGDELPRHSN